MQELETLNHQRDYLSRACLPERRYGTPWEGYYSPLGSVQGPCDPQINNKMDKCMQGNTTARFVSIQVSS